MKSVAASTVFVNSGADVTPPLVAVELWLLWLLLLLFGLDHDCSLDEDGFLPPPPAAVGPLPSSAEAPLGSAARRVVMAGSTPMK